MNGWTNHSPLAFCRTLSSIGLLPCFQGLTTILLRNIVSVIKKSYSLLLIFHIKSYFLVQIFSIGSYGTKYSLYSFRKHRWRVFKQFCGKSPLTFLAIFFWGTFRLMFIHLDIKSKWFELEKSSWQHLTDFLKLFLMVTGFYMVF